MFAVDPQTFENREKWSRKFNFNLECLKEFKLSQPPGGEAEFAFLRVYLMQPLLPDFNALFERDYPRIPDDYRRLARYLNQYRPYLKDLVLMISRDYKNKDRQFLNILWLNRVPGFYLYKWQLEVCLLAQQGESKGSPQVPHFINLQEADSPPGNEGIELKNFDYQYVLLASRQKNDFSQWKNALTAKGLKLKLRKEFMIGKIKNQKVAPFYLRLYDLKGKNKY